MVLAMSEAETANAAKATPTKDRRRNSDRSSIGCFATDCRTTKPTSSATAVASSPMMRAEPQPSSLPRIRPSSRASRPVVSSAVPGQSAERATGGRDSESRSAPAISANTPIGRLTRKIHRQPGPSTRSPPASGPTAVAAARVAPKMPTAPARAFGCGKAAPISGRPTPNSSAPPTPCTARIRSRESGDQATAQPSEPRVKIAMPARKIRRRPIRSPSVAAVRSRPARARVYASITHCSSPRSAEKSRWMSLSATVTIVTSSSSMKVATQTIARVQPGLVGRRLGVRMAPPVRQQV